MQILPTEHATPNMVFTRNQVDGQVKKRIENL